jgi:hypothetical protein
MSLIGLTKRNSMCKICTAFDDDEILTAINLDILLGRRTYKEIREHYTPLMPSLITSPITDSNINNHRRHCDPKLIVDQTLREKNKAVTESDFAAVLYAERFNEVVDKKKVIESLYKSRINTVQFLRDLLKDKQDDYIQYKKQIKEGDKVTVAVATGKSKSTESDIRNLIDQIDDIEVSIQQTILKDFSVEKGPGNTYINQNFVNVFENSLKGFMTEAIPYLLYSVFQNDIEKGKEVIAQLSSYMDKHLTPTLKQVNQSKSLLN